MVDGENPSRGVCMPYETKARALERGEIMDKNNDNDNEPIHILSLGAGVQSSCMALMASSWNTVPTLNDMA